MKSIVRPLIIGISISTVAIGASVYASQAAALPAEQPAYAKYHNERWHFSLFVPPDMKVDEYESEGNGQSVVFSNADGTKEFYVSAWPYTQLDLTLDREGTAGGASDQPDHLEIVDVIREGLFSVLFQKNGVSYEVYTKAELEPWLIEILKTWKFDD